MKNLLFLFAVLLLVGCQKDESFDQQTQTSSQDFLLQTPKAALDNATLGLYRGVIASYNQAIHGEIAISLKNDGSLRAVAVLLDGTKMEFEGMQISELEFAFKGNRGSFEFTLGNNKTIKIEDAILDNESGAIMAYKESSGGGGITIAFGTYIDDIDPTFSGIFDMINFGLIEGSAGGAVIQDILITHTSGFMYTDATAGTYEAFTPCILFPATEPYVITGSNNFINAKDQVSTFDGVVCSWSLQYANNSTVTVYSDDDTCATTAPGGTWSWKSRSGTITVLSPAI